MSIEFIRQNHPEIYQAIYRRGIAAARRKQNPGPKATDLKDWKPEYGFPF